MSYCVRLVLPVIDPVIPSPTGKFPDVKRPLTRDLRLLWHQAVDYFTAHAGKPLLTDDNARWWYSVRIDAADVFECFAQWEESLDPERREQRRTQNFENYEMSPADAYVDIHIYDPRDSEADVPPHVLDKFLDQLWLAFNLAVPGALDLAEAEYAASTLDHDEPPKLDAHALGIAYVAAIERAWPRLRPLPFGDLWEWLHRDMVYDLEVAETPVEIALVTLLQVSQRAPLDSANVVSVALALESLFGSRRDGVLRVIRPRIEAKLGRPSGRANWLSKFYDVRSRIAHGAGPIWRARRSYARGSYPKLEKYVTDVGLALSDRLGVLLAVSQDFVVTNKRQYLFTQPGNRTP